MPKNLATGANPTYVARQTGHKNAKMLFTVYAKWIDGADRGREKAKLQELVRAIKKPPEGGGFSGTLRGNVPRMSLEDSEAGHFRKNW